MGVSRRDRVGKDRTPSPATGTFAWGGFATVRFQEGTWRSERWQNGSWPTCHRRRAELGVPAACALVGRPVSRDCSDRKPSRTSSVAKPRAGARWPQPERWRTSVAIAVVITAPKSASAAARVLRLNDAKPPPTSKAATKNRKSFGKPHRRKLAPASPMLRAFETPAPTNASAVASVRAASTGR